MSVEVEQEYSNTMQDALTYEMNQVRPLKYCQANDQGDHVIKGVLYEFAIRSVEPHELAKAVLGLDEVEKERPHWVSRVIRKPWIPTRPEVFMMLLVDGGK